MKVLIAGGTGLIGQRLSELLIQNNYDVVHLSRKAAKNSKFATYFWDVEQQIVDTKAFVNVDYVINLSGENIASGKWTAKQREKIINSRIDSNRLLKSAFIDTKFFPKKYISSAAIGYYGSSNIKEFNENSSPENSGFLSKTCQKWEESIQEIQQIGVSTAWVRIGVVLSSKGGALKEMISTAKYGLNLYFGNGKQFYSWVHIDDLCQIFLYLINNQEAAGVYNGCSPYSNTNFEIALALSKTIGINTMLISIPAFFLKLFLGEMSSVIMDSTKVVPQRLLKDNFSFKYENIDFAINDVWKRKI